jgi:hypothetical protein
LMIKADSKQSAAIYLADREFIKGANLPVGLMFTGAWGGPIPCCCDWRDR